MKWKGEEADSGTKHEWIRKWKARKDGGIPDRCEYCGEKTEEVDCACLIKGAGPDNPEAYTRRMIDYVWLCRKCHNRMDQGDEEIRKKLIAQNKEKYTGDEWTGEQMKKKRKKPVGFIPIPLHYDDDNFKEGVCPYCPYENPFYTHDDLRAHLLKYHRDKINEGLRGVKGVTERWVAGYIASAIAGLLRQR